MSDSPSATLDVIEQAIERNPANGNLHLLHGRVLATTGRRTEALAALSTALSVGTDREILDFAAEVAFPGPRYKEHLAWLHRELRPATYLEIGIYKGETLALAQPGTQVIGVDPAPRPEAARSYDASTCIHRVTSDAYFAEVAAGSIASPKPIELAFIDGLHLFEQVLRDFANTEKYCDSSSIIVLHDTLPIAADATARKRFTSYWCGDVWKIIPCLRRYRPDLSMLTIPTHPSGLTIVAGVNPDCDVLDRCFEQAVGDFTDAPLVPLELTDGAFGDVSNDAGAIREWLAATPAGRRLVS